VRVGGDLKFEVRRAAVAKRIGIVIVAVVLKPKTFADFAQPFYQDGKCDRIPPP
jgi:hypothetical protein